MADSSACEKSSIIGKHRMAKIIDVAGGTAAWSTFLYTRVLANSPAQGFSRTMPPPLKALTYETFA